MSDRGALAHHAPSSALALAALLAVACATPPPPPPAATPAPVATAAPDPDLERCGHRVCVRATLSETGTVTVELVIPRAALPAGTQRLELPFYDEPFKGGGGYHRFVRADAPFVYDAGAVLQRVRYRVPLEHHRAHPAHGLDEVPHPLDAGWFLVGRAFIPVLKADGAIIDPPAVLELTVPAGRAVATEAGLAEGDPASGRATRAGTLGQLTHAYYYTGNFAEASVVHGATTLRIVTTDHRAHLPAMAALVQRILDAGAAVLGPVPPARRLLAFDRLPQGFAGGVIGNDISFMSSLPLSGRALSPDALVLTHELVHLWSHADVPWLSEGFTEYFAVLLAARLDGVAPERAAEVALRSFEPYRAGLAQGPIGRGEGGWIYPAGVILGLCLDARLAPSASALGLYGQLLAARAPGAGVTAVGYLAAVGAASAEARRDLDAMLASTEPIDVAGCLSRASMPTEAVRYRGYPLRVLVLDVLQITGFSPQRAEVFAAKPGSALRAGDLVISVGGVPVATIPEVDWALRGHKPGAQVPAVVLRDGREATVQLVVPKVPADKLEAKTRLRPLAGRGRARAPAPSWPPAPPR